MRILLPIAQSHVDTFHEVCRKIVDEKVDLQVLFITQLLSNNVKATILKSASKEHKMWSK